MHPIATETVPISHMEYRLRQLSAQYRPDKTSNPKVSHIYYSAPSRRWLLVKRKNAQAVVITHWATCPCALTQASV